MEKKISDVEVVLVQSYDSEEDIPSKTCIITFKAPEWLRKALDKCAKKKLVSRSDIIREAIKLYIEIQGCAT